MLAWAYLSSYRHGFVNWLERGLTSSYNQHYLTKIFGMNFEAQYCNIITHFHGFHSLFLCVPAVTVRQLWLGFYIHCWLKKKGCVLIRLQILINGSMCLRDVLNQGVICSPALNFQHTEFLWRPLNLRSNCLSTLLACEVQKVWKVLNKVWLLIHTK